MFFDKNNDSLNDDSLSTNNKNNVPAHIFKDESKV
jgi:hypothetical protein